MAAQLVQQPREGGLTEQVVEPRQQRPSEDGGRGGDGNGCLGGEPRAAREHREQEGKPHRLRLDWRARAPAEQARRPVSGATGHPERCDGNGEQ